MKPYTDVNVRFVAKCVTSGCDFDSFWNDTEDSAVQAGIDHLCELAEGGTHPNPKHEVEVTRSVVVTGGWR